MLDFDGDAELKKHEVRLFPPVHISSDREAEQRATAALLAVVKGVSEFGRAIVKIAGGPAGKIACYTEVCLPALEPEGPRPRPDGIIRSTRGKQDWKALVEVKVGDALLEQAQFDTYQRLAKEHGFDALVTISSQAAGVGGLPPLNVDGRRLRGVPVVHFSWDRLLSEARMLAQQNAVEDPDQAWILAEWIRYVADPLSKIVAPAQLGPHWNDILRAAREANLLSVAKHVEGFVGAWEDYVKKQTLHLRAKLGVDVQPKIPLRERQDPALRVKRLCVDVLERARVVTEIRIPDAAGDISLELGLQAQVIRFSVELEAPTDGRQQTRINWLLRQLRHEKVPQDLVIKTDWDRKGLMSQAKISDALQDPACLLRDGHRQQIAGDAVPRRFLLEWTRTLQKSRGRSTASVLDGISADLEAFYGCVLERLSAFVPLAPRLPVPAVDVEKRTDAQMPVAAVAPPVLAPPSVVDSTTVEPQASEVFSADGSSVSKTEANEATALPVTD
jgi:hypothetical protein